MSHTIHIIMMCNNITVFTKSAQKFNMRGGFPIFGMTDSDSIEV